MWRLYSKILLLLSITNQQTIAEGFILKSLMRRIRNPRKRRLENQANEPGSDARSLKQAIEKLRAQIPDATDHQVQIVNAVRELTMTSPERILAVCNAVEYLAKNKIVGDFVECGVWRGGSMAAAAKTLVHVGTTDRQLWMYDTYDGMSEPTEEDVDYLGHTAEKLLNEQDRDDAMSVWCCSPLDQVKQTMTQTEYPIDQVRFIEGKVEDTLPHTTPEKIAMLRLDTDWYESTRCELEHLFPKLVPGGVLIVDDYGHWEGCRRAVDEYFQKNKIPMLLNRIDYTGRIGIYCPGSN